MNRLPVIVRQHIAAFRALLVFTVLFGLIYPLVMTGVSQVAFHNKANGSLVSYNGRVVGSGLLCQEFVDAKGNPLPQYFQPRPSDAVVSGDKNDYGCDPLYSAASNLGPNNPDEIRPSSSGRSRSPLRPRAGRADPAGRGDRVRLRAGPGHHARERLHPGRAGGRGPAAAGREVRDLVTANTTGRTLGFLGEPAVNVLSLNIKLDELSATSG